MRAPNMQKLTDQIKDKHNGIVIYGIGDATHKLRISDHNEDDTAGVRAAQSDADNIPEHRAIDVMIGDHFSRADAENLVKDLTTVDANQDRLKYVIFDSKIYSANDGWGADDYDGEDQHEGHVHVSGLASNDADTSPWVLSSPGVGDDDNDQLVVDGILGPKTIKRWQQIMGTKVDGVISENSQLVKKVQEKLKATVDHRLVVDGDGNSLDVGVFRKTVAALQRYLKSPVDGVITPGNSQVIKALQRRLNQNRF